MPRHRWATADPRPPGLSGHVSEAALDAARSVPRGRSPRNGASFARRAVEGRPEGYARGGPATAGPPDPAEEIVASADAEREPGDPEAPRAGRRRWAAARGVSLVFLALALTLGGGLYFFRVGDAPPAATIQLREEPGSALEGGPTPSPGSAEETGPAPEGGLEPGSADLPGATPADGGPPGLLSGSGGPGSGGPEGSGSVYVHVTGAVASPGVLEVPVGSRLFQVLELAGGATHGADLAAVNLAAVVSDGGQVHVPRTGEPVPPAAPPLPDGTGSAEGNPQPGSVNLNTADAAALEELPRVGPVLAERIVAWRTENGPFASTADLDAVPGIGPALLEALLPLVVVR